MSRSHHNGHGRCWCCGDKGEARRKRDAQSAADIEEERGHLAACIWYSPCDDCTECGRPYGNCGDDYEWLSNPAANANEPLRVSLSKRLAS